MLQILKAAWCHNIAVCLYAASFLSQTETNPFLLALHVFQARLWCICLGMCAWCKGIGRFQGIVSGKKSLETDDFVIWVYECWILDLGNTNLFRHKNLYKFYIQIEREGESKRCFQHVITPTELLGPRRCCVLWHDLLQPWRPGNSCTSCITIYPWHFIKCFLKRTYCNTVRVHVNLFDLIHLSCVSVCSYCNILQHNIACLCFFCSGYIIYYRYYVNICFWIDRGLHTVDDTFDLALRSLQISWQPVASASHISGERQKGLLVFIWAIQHARAHSEEAGHVGWKHALWPELADFLSGTWEGERWWMMMMMMMMMMWKYFKIHIFMTGIWKWEVGLPTNIQCSFYFCISSS